MCAKLSTPMRGSQMDVFNVKPPPPGMIAEGFRCQAEISGFQSVKAKWQVTT